MRALLSAICLAALAFTIRAEEQPPERPQFVSPDKKWEFRVTGEKALLVKVESNEPVLDLAEEIGYLALESGEIVWARDSRRFAFNSRKGGRYFGCDLYELAGIRWKKLPSLEDNAKDVNQMIERALRKELRRLGAKPDASPNAVMNQWRLRRWIDNDTFEAYVLDQQRVLVHENDENPEYLGCAVLFRGKCDNRGGWKVISSRELSDAENEKINEDEE